MSTALHSIKFTYVQRVVVGRERSARARGSDPRDASSAFRSTKCYCQCYYCRSLLLYIFRVGLHVLILWGFCKTIAKSYVNFVMSARLGVHVEQSDARSTDFS